MSAGAVDAANALLPEIIWRHFTQLRHAGELAPGEGRICSGEAGREAVGTRVRFVMRILGRRICAVRYLAYGCPHTLAACEWLAKRLEGQSLDDISIGSPNTWASNLEVPAHKLGRLLIIEDALSAALTAGSKAE